MTTITATTRVPSIRPWEAEENIFVAEIGGHSPTFVFNFTEVHDTYSYEPLFAPIEASPVGAKWFNATVEKIIGLPFHTDNWSTGAKRTEGTSVTQLLATLFQILPDDAPAPTIIPTWLGGAQAEWHLKGVDLEIYANPGEAVEYYFNNGDDEREGIARNDWAKLREFARTIA